MCRQIRPTGLTAKPRSPSLFETDHPLADPSSVTGQIRHTQPVPNLRRITAQGSDNAPGEWLPTDFDSRKASPFSWTNVPYPVRRDRRGLRAGPLRRYQIIHRRGDAAFTMRHAA